MTIALALTSWTMGVSSAFALSTVALIGYLFGRSQRHAPEVGEGSGREEIQRAARIARQLEQIADDLRQDLAFHRQQVEQFKSQLRHAERETEDVAWARLRSEAEKMVAPTLQLVSQLSTAYDKIRQQSQSLANFTGGRTDPLTGLANSRSLEEHLGVLLKSRTTGGGESSLVVVSLDGERAERSQHDQLVREIGRRLADGLRGDDFAARYGVDDFVVVLPATPLAGAGVFGTRLRKTIADEFGVTICCGLAESMPADTPKSFLARADSAAYSAQAAGAGQQYVHTGAAIRPDTQEQPSATPTPLTEPRAVAPSTVNEAPDEPVTKEGSVAKPAIPASLELAGPPIAPGLLITSAD